MRIIHTNSESETEALGRALGETLAPGTVLALYGGLGAGKTAFVRGVAQGLKCAARVSSPTFTVVNEYPGNIPLFHFDMYRLQSADELFELGWDEYLERGGVTAVEWSERVADCLPPEAVSVRFLHTGGDTRRIEISGGVL
jgi:tRNA threonylcarbamoyladenosine biosynthesis protein TsaE